MVTVYYLDTSIAMHALGREPRAIRWFEQETEHPESMIVSSRLLQTEVTRALRRDGIPVHHREPLLRRISIAPLTESILTSAEAIVPHVKSLDAIHLATALALGSATIVVTHDANVKRVADELGLQSYDPLT